MSNDIKRPCSHKAPEQKKKVTPDFYQKLIDYKKKWRMRACKWKYRMQTSLYDFSCSLKKSDWKGKSLYVSAIGKDGKAYFEKIIRRFGCEDFEYLILVYDDTRLDEDIFKPCRIIYEKGMKWSFAKRYVTRDVCTQYDYIFVWDDDIDIGKFDVRDFLEILRRKNLQFAQPALALGSRYSYPITLVDKGSSIGRYTDFVEMMVPVFTSKAWKKFWGLLEYDENPWGWGYSALIKSYCGFSNMGIVDNQAVTHTRPFRSHITTAPKDMERLICKHNRCKKSLHVCYGHF